MKYLAHISEDGLREQTVEEHNEAVASMAEEFAEKFHAGSWGYCCGLLHDVGKQTKEFQARLHGDPQRVDHSTAGAQELQRYGDRNRTMHALLAPCVAGHHAGMPDKGTEADAADRSTMTARLKRKIPAYGEGVDEIEIPPLITPSLKMIGKGGFSIAFYLRMIFSCLVDADYLDTEEFMTDGRTGREPRTVDIGHLNSLLEYVEPWRKNRDLETINGRRTEVLEAALSMGKKKPGIYSMTVPTGGGKTVASLAFALQHACEYGKDRIIYVIPYTSIIEQNAQVFREILGDENVLEHHSNVEYGGNDANSEELNPMQLASENWDKPVIVTTNVQFFESLFSNRPAKCRKLHNMANSVIIFDEAQMLPTDFLIPCVRAIEELAINYESTVVLCSATQPSLQKFFSKGVQVREICPQVEEQFTFFQRATVTSIGEMKEAELVERLCEENQALCILNSRARVQKIYQELRGDGVYHLSTYMYSEHRKRILLAIRQCLKAGEKCVVIATSLVEAGVDLDFQTVYRELAGIDSIVQAAGRCNREGKRPVSESRTYAFTLEEKATVPYALKQPISVANEIAEEYADISSLDAICDYFDRLHYIRGGQLDAQKIVGQFEEGARTANYPFATVAKEFKLIQENTRTILIGKEKRAAELIERIRYGERTVKLLREVGKYGVQVYEKDFERLLGAGVLELTDLGDNQVAILKDLDKYQEDMGLVVDVNEGDAVFA